MPPGVVGGAFLLIFSIQPRALSPWAQSTVQYLPERRHFRSPESGGKGVGKHLCTSMILCCYNRSLKTSPEKRYSKLVSQSFDERFHSVLRPYHQFPRRRCLRSGVGRTALGGFRLQVSAEQYLHYATSVGGTCACTHICCSTSHTASDKTQRILPGKCTATKSTWLETAVTPPAM